MRRKRKVIAITGQMILMNVTTPCCAMITKLLFFLITVILVQSAHLAQADTLSEYNKLATQMTQQFWPNVQAKLSLLPQNYIVYKSEGAIEFSDSHGNGCRSNQSQNMAAIHHSYSQNRYSDIYEFTYVGCQTKPVFFEVISSKYKKTPTNKMSSYISGQREFIASNESPSRQHSYYDSAYKPLLEIESEYSPDFAQTTFVVVGKIMTRIEANFSEKQIRVFVYSDRYRHDFPEGGIVNANYSFSSNPVIHQIELTASGLNKYSYISKKQSEQSQKSFNGYFSQVALKVLKQVPGGIFDYLLNFMPRTETASSGLANKRLLNELIVISNRLRLGGILDINFAITQIKSYIKAIEDGDLVIIDNRPE